MQAGYRPVETVINLNSLQNLNARLGSQHQLQIMARLHGGGSGATRFPTDAPAPPTVASGLTNLHGSVWTGNVPGTTTPYLELGAGTATPFAPTAGGLPRPTQPLAAGYPVVPAALQTVRVLDPNGVEQPNDGSVWPGVFGINAYWVHPGAQEMFMEITFTTTSAMTPANPEGSIMIPFGIHGSLTFVLPIQANHADSRLEITRNHFGTEWVLVNQRLVEAVPGANFAGRATSPRDFHTILELPTITIDERATQAGGRGITNAPLVAGGSITTVNWQQTFLNMWNNNQSNRDALRAAGFMFGAPNSIDAGTFATWFTGTAGGNIPLITSGFVIGSAPSIPVNAPAIVHAWLENTANHVPMTVTNSSGGWFTLRLEAQIHYRWEVTNPLSHLLGVPGGSFNVGQDRSTFRRLAAAGPATFTTQIRNEMNPVDGIPRSVLYVRINAEEDNRAFEHVNEVLHLTGMWLHPSALAPAEGPVTVLASWGHSPNNDVLNFVFNRQGDLPIPDPAPNGVLNVGRRVPAGTLRIDTPLTSGADMQSGLLPGNNLAISAGPLSAAIPISMPTVPFGITGEGALFRTHAIEVVETLPGTLLTALNTPIRFTIDSEYVRIVGARIQIGTNEGAGNVNNILAPEWQHLNLNGTLPHRPDRMVDVDFNAVTVHFPGVSMARHRESLRIRAQFDIVIASGYEWRHGEDIKVVISGAGIEQELTLDERTVTIATVEDPIRIERTTRALDVGSRYHVAGADIDDIVIQFQRNDMNTIRSGDEIWVYIDQPNRSLNNLSIDRGFTVDWNRESGMRLGDVRELINRATGVMDGWIIPITTPPQAGAPLPVITLSGLTVTGEVLPNVDYIVAVSGTRIAQNEQRVRASRVDQGHIGTMNEIHFNTFTVGIPFWAQTIVHGGGGPLDQAPDWYAEPPVITDIEEIVRDIVNDIVSDVVGGLDLNPIVNVPPVIIPPELLPPQTPAPVEFRFSEFTSNLMGVDDPFEWRIIEGNRVGFMSIRAFIYLIGGTLADDAWDPSTNTARVTGTHFDGTPVTVTLTVGNPNAQIEGRPGTVDIAEVAGVSGPFGSISPYISQDRVMLPLRFIATLFGYTVTLEGNTVVFR
jgi:hypothetical protein